MEPSYIDRAELLAIFSAESEENLREMEEALRAASSPRPTTTRRCRPIFRAAHTIKGNAAGLGFPALAKFAHARRGRARPAAHRAPWSLTTPLATILLQSVDALAPAGDAARQAATTNCYRSTSS